MADHQQGSVHEQASVHQRALAYLLGMEGMALLRAFGGEHGADFTEARIAEIRRLLDEPALRGGGVTAARVSAVDGYRVWSATYDEPGNGLFAIEEPLLHDILDAMTPGVALDAACGTGRYAGYLVGRGHRVIGVDGSPDMLARARIRVPAADFRDGDLGRLPVTDGAVDLVVCTLALTHVPDLRPVLAEFARVLRPGGHLVISDVHHEWVLLGSMPRVRSGGEPAMLPAYRHRAGDYLNAALPLGFQVRRYVEPIGADPHGEPAAEPDPGPWDGWPWSLLDIVPAATAAAWATTPTLAIWHFQLAG
jgi:SAM-dependent methyltransferase